MGAIRYSSIVLLSFVCQLLYAANDGFDWSSSYAEAMNQAKLSGKSMLICFTKDGVSADKDIHCIRLVSEPPLQPLVSKFILAQLPLSYEIRMGGKSSRLLDHPAFAELGRQPGIVIIDFANPRGKYYGQVVSVYPTSLPAATSIRSLKALLTLPEGSLTQRTLILAVRLHPERPASTEGTWLASLARETESHSRHQAAINLQGHHQWERRFHRISALLPGGGYAQEVCAESWPGMGLVAAALDCVHSWRQSSGHWSAVRNRHRFYGYDMKRGSNGVWYATGIFSEN